MHTEIITRLDDLPAADWNRISGTSHPFLRHEFLAALERHGCVGERYGWYPCHIVARDDAGVACGAVPLYLKDNSYGEFVFDWAWADAWHRAGLHYYPKLVASIPYTPVTGARLLLAPGTDRAAVGTALIEAALALCEHSNASSLHWLFSDGADTALLQQHGFMRRTGVHFHWHNAGYRTFDDFLAALTARKRKKIRRERRFVADAGIRMQILSGAQASEADWNVMHHCYRSTFEKKSGIPTLSREFFMDISASMGEQVLLVFARRADRVVAGAIMLRGDDALYGRHWGCLDDYHSLHFETCYYQGIEYAIRHGLRLFEPGAQGEHKVSRGFLPTFTWSAHRVRDERLGAALERYVRHEHDMMVEYHADLQATSPFRAAAPVATP